MVRVYTAFSLSTFRGEDQSRAPAGVPPCSAAEFADLAAWLAARRGALPTVNGWKDDLDVGDGTTVTLPGLTWRAQRGPSAGGSGGVAEAIRKLRARHAEGAVPPVAPIGGRSPAAPPRGWVPSVVRDDEYSGPP